MKREFIMTKVFDKLWSLHNMTDDDLHILQIELMTNPRIGDIIQSTSGARKTRFAIKNKGKRGGMRVIYVDLENKEQLYLLLCYPKNQQDNLTPEQKKQIKILIETLKGV